MATATVIRILVVEDDRETAERIKKRIESQLASSVRIAETREEAERLINEQTFDAAVVDLRIPERPGIGAADIVHGKAVEAVLAREQPGVLRVFFTASSGETVESQISSGRSDDFFKIGESFALVRHRRKSLDGLKSCVEILAEHNVRLEALDDMRLSGASSLDLDQRRAAALTLRIMGSDEGHIVSSSGFSSAKTAKVEGRDSSGRTSGSAFCKVGPTWLIEKEIAGYKMAAFRLPSSNFPKLDEVLEVGIGRNKALVLTEAPKATTLFELADLDGQPAKQAIERLPAVLDSWSSVSTTESVAVLDLVRDEISETVSAQFASELAQLELDRLAGLEIPMLHYVQHGDFHGGNLLITDATEPFLIDFAQAGPKSGPVDAVSLELSVFFHPDSPRYGPLSPDVYDRWHRDFVTEHFGSDRPLAKECRAWAASSGHSAQEYAVATLLYCLWILNHTDHPETAIAIASASMETLLGD